MRSHGRPRLVVSRCIEFDHCRWNGLMVTSDVVKLLKPYVDVITVCGEVEIGLGVPRQPIRIVAREGREVLYQPATGRDCTDAMRAFAQQFCDGLGQVDGFILKNRSPTCGLGDVRIYPDREKAQALGKTRGIFAAEVLERYGDLPIEDEGRLTNYNLRDHFLRSIFTLASFRALAANPSMAGLVRFQADNKLLLMAANQTAMREMGRLVANHDHAPLSEIIGAYGVALRRALATPPSYGANVNVLQHAFGYFSDDLLSAERDFYLNCLQEYRDGQLPLSVPTSIMRAWIIRFGNAYLASQTYFAPYPDDLVAITDSGKGRDL